MTVKCFKVRGMYIPATSIAVIVPDFPRAGGCQLQLVNGTTVDISRPIVPPREAPSQPMIAPPIPTRSVVDEIFEYFGIQE